MDTWEEKQQYEEEDGEWDGRRDRLNEILSSDDDEDDVEYAYQTFYKTNVDGLKDLDDGIVKEFEEKIKRHLYTDGKFHAVDEKYFLTDYMKIPDKEFKAGIGKPTALTATSTAEAAAKEREEKIGAFIKHIKDGKTVIEKLDISKKGNYAKDKSDNHYIRRDIKSQEKLLTSLKQTPVPVPDGGADGNALLEFLEQAKREAGETRKAEAAKRIAEEEAQKAIEEKKHQEQMKDVLNNMSNQLELNLKEFNSTLTTPAKPGEKTKLKTIEAPSDVDPGIKKAVEEIQRQSEFNKVLFDFLRNIADVRRRYKKRDETSKLEDEIKMKTKEIENLSDKDTEKLENQLDQLTQDLDKLNFEKEKNDDNLHVIRDILAQIKDLIQNMPTEGLSEIFNVYQTEQEVINDAIQYIDKRMAETDMIIRVKDKINSLLNNKDDNIIYIYIKMWS